MSASFGSFFSRIANQRFFNKSGIDGGYNALKQMGINNTQMTQMRLASQSAQQANKLPGQQSTFQRLIFGTRDGGRNVGEGPTFQSFGDKVPQPPKFQDTGRWGQNSNTANNAFTPVSDYR